MNPISQLLTTEALETTDDTIQVIGPYTAQVAEIQTVSRQMRQQVAETRLVRQRLVDALTAAEARHDSFATHLCRQQLADLDAAIFALAADIRRLEAGYHAWLDGWPEPQRTAVSDRIRFAHQQRQQKIAQQHTQQHTQQAQARRLESEPPKGGA